MPSRNRRSLPKAAFGSARRTVSPIRLQPSVTGRGSRVPASRNPLLLPRSMAIAFPGRVKDLAYRSSRVRVLRSPLAIEGRRPVNLTAQLSMLRARHNSRIARSELIRPTLNRLKSPCQVRQVRKSVLFSAGVAGSRWGTKKGPVMRGAKRTLTSQFRCG